MSSKIVYTIIPKDAVTDSVLKQCADLFSNHYGTWSNKTEHQQFLPPRARGGTHVKYTADRLRTACLFNPRCGLVTATVDDLLVGHAFFTTFNVPPSEIKTVQFLTRNSEVRWVTQLVVHSDYRRQKIAQNLLLHSLGTQAQFYGLVTSHPHAVRALERAVRSNCLNLDSNDVKLILEKSEIPYLNPSEVEICCNETQSLVNTNFFVDHTEVKTALEEEIQRNERVDAEIKQLELRRIARHHTLKREKLVKSEIHSLERFKQFDQKDVYGMGSTIAKLQKELTNVENTLKSIGREKSEVEKQMPPKWFIEKNKWVIGDELPDGQEFVAIAYQPMIIPLPPIPTNSQIPTSPIRRRLQK
jgi:hypothetical protein